ncbi:MAG TPA: hypothetical protein VGF30_09165 [Bacteroidia bacterium]
MNTFLFTGMLSGLNEFFSGQATPGMISSDSTLMYLQVFLLAVVSFLISITVQFIKVKEEKKLRFISFTHSLLTYFLALHLMKYGFDKVFKTQFYQPEPNTLFTPFGFLDKDILFWSTIGTSHPYNVVTGALEIIAALLLVFHRTRRAGLVLSLGLLLHICLINFSFDISVKLFSIFLLGITCLLIAPDLKNFITFFFKRQLNQQNEPLPLWILNKQVKVGLKCFVILVIISESIYPAVLSGNFNDDRAQRPYLHGAYEVWSIEPKENTLNIALPDIKRVFIHRRGYIIFQHDNDSMSDYKLNIDSIKHTFELTDHKLVTTTIPYVYYPVDSTLVLNSAYKITAKAIDWRTLPALRKGFHFRSDSEF